MLQMRSDDEVGGIHSARMTLSHTKAGWQRSAPVVFAKKFFGHGVHLVPGLKVLLVKAWVHLAPRAVLAGPHRQRDRSVPLSWRGGGARRGCAKQGRDGDGALRTLMHIRTHMFKNNTNDPIPWPAEKQTH